MADQPTGKKPGIGARVYRQLFKVFGPAQIGDYSAPAKPKPVVDRPCSQCGRPQSEHIVERSREIARLRCPS